jgi:hypothetical protein
MTSQATPDLGYFSTLAALRAAFTASGVPTGATAKTGDLGPVYSNGTYWVPANFPNSPWAYNAVGDGVADDTTAVQAAATSGYCVFPPNATFMTTAPIQVPSGGTFIGSGASSIIYPNFAVNTLSGAVQIGTSGTAAVNCKVGNFRINASNQAPPILVKCLNMQMSDVSDIWCNGSNYLLAGFYFDICYGNKLSNLNLSNAGCYLSTTGVTFTGSVGGAASGTLTAAFPARVAGLCSMVFSNGQIRLCTIGANPYTAVTWHGALAAGTITKAYYGSGFWCGGAFNTNTCSNWYTGGGDPGAYGLYLNDDNGIGQSGASVFNGFCAQQPLVGVYAGTKHVGHTFNSPYFEDTVRPIVLGNSTDTSSGGGTIAYSHVFNSPLLAPCYNSHALVAQQRALIEYDVANGITLNAPSFYASSSLETYFPYLTFSGGGSPSANAYGYLLVSPSGVPKAAILTYGGAGYGSAPTVTIHAGAGSGCTVTAAESGGIVNGLTISGPGSGYQGNGYGASTAVPILYTYAANCSIKDPGSMSSSYIFCNSLFPWICRTSGAGNGSGINITGDTIWLIDHANVGGFFDGPFPEVTVRKTSGADYTHTAFYYSNAGSPVITYCPNAAGTNTFLPAVIP